MKQASPSFIATSSFDYQQNMCLNAQKRTKSLKSKTVPKTLC